MRYLFAVLGIFAFLGALLFFAAAKSAVHEIEALILFLIAAVLEVGSVVVGLLEELPKRLQESRTGGTATATAKY